MLKLHTGTHRFLRSAIDQYAELFCYAAPHEGFEIPTAEELVASGWESAGMALREAINDKKQQAESARKSL